MARSTVVLPQPDGPDQRGHLAGGELEGDVANRDMGPEGHAHVLERHCRLTEGGWPQGGPCRGFEGDRRRGTGVASRRRLTSRDVLEAARLFPADHH